jgi:hypothetical protein
MDYREAAEILLLFCGDLADWARLSYRERSLDEDGETT